MSLDCGGAQSWVRREKMVIEACELVQVSLESLHVCRVFATNYSQLSAGIMHVPLNTFS